MYPYAKTTPFPLLTPIKHPYSRLARRLRAAARRCGLQFRHALENLTATRHWRRIPRPQDTAPPEVVEATVVMALSPCSSSRRSSTRSSWVHRPLFLTRSPCRPRGRASSRRRLKGHAEADEARY